ncbi:MAG TPA: CaiB/BaiF CoA-transferase family protein [Amycolatopsis sp.]|nr:CaiB/BaiF CoA-transferase family protein [Amycolatopsis sp.]
MSQAFPQRPLDGVRVVELAGIGPAPHAGMMLADLGAEVVRVQRPGAPPDLPGGVPDFSSRGKRIVAADLKSDVDRARVLDLIAQADVLVEGFRPGVTERLGLGPDECRRRNPRLVYARVTGWGQDGPYAGQAGHDINYISITGALNAIGTPDRPVPPLNLIGDFGGGSMLVLVGILAALLERQRSGEGQVVDAAMVDGTSLLMQTLWWLYASGHWQDERSSNSLDGGAPFYRTYRCADGRYVAVGCLETQFYAELIRLLDLDPATLPDQRDQSGWPRLAEAIGGAFARQTRDHWAKLFEGTDACVTPVLALSEVPAHPQIMARRSVTDHAAPAPRFSRTRTDEIAPVDAEPLELGDVLARWAGS